MPRTYFLLFIITCIANITVAQPTEQQIQTVLKANVIDSLFVFDNSTKQGKATNYNIVNLKYLGSVTTIKGNTFKLISSIWIWGLSQRGTTRILVYNDKNQYVGNYNMDLVSNAPTKLDKGILVFENDKRRSGSNSKTVRVNLKHGLPNSFYLNGDFHSFEQ